MTLVPVSSSWIRVVERPSRGVVVRWFRRLSSADRENVRRRERYRRDPTWRARKHKIAAAWVAAHSERNRQNQRAWRERNRERHAEQQRAWRDANRDRRRAYAQTYKARRRELYRLAKKGTP